MTFNRLMFLVLALFAIGVLLMLLTLASDYITSWKKRRAMQRVDQALRTRSITRIM
jgi:hypothetical protein